MNNISNFLTKPNISMIWDVITDEDIFKFLSRDIQSKISEVFTNNLKGFYDNEIQKNNTLIELNKKYILLMLSFIKSNYPQQPNKIKILEELLPTNQKKLITYEEIQNDRKTQFERDLLKRQDDFSNAITLKVPPVPEFTDKLEDVPITEMEKIIKEMTAQRNYEVEQINRSYNNNDTWLKSQETSIKNEKFIPLKQDNTSTISSRLKYLKIEGEEQTAYEEKRNVTWGENVMMEFEENDSVNVNTINSNKLAEESIFKKLKRIDTAPITNNNEEMKLNILNITNRLSEMQEEMIKMQDFLKTLT